jgi:hypothetical protein
VKLDHGDVVVHDDDRGLGSLFVDSRDSVYCDESHFFASDANADCCGYWFWASAEYLYWHERGMEIPALVTSSTPGTPRDQVGVLGQSTTTVLLGNERFVDDGQSGGRFSFGFWLDDCREASIDFVYTSLFDQSDSFAASSDQFSTLARPFFNVVTLAEDARVLGFPSELSGGVRVEGSTEYDVYEVLVRQTISRERVPTYIVYGYRHAELNDSLLISDSSLSLSGASTGVTVSSLDSFRSKNRFNGFEAGILTDFRVSQCWELNIAGKVAFGETNHVTTISGQSISTNDQGDTASSSGGLLTQQSNIGRFESNSHGVLQDFRVGLRRYIQSGISADLGYAIHRWTDVARAGEQIDLSLNPTQIPPSTIVGDARPAPRNAISNFVAQGITLGLEFVW